MKPTGTASAREIVLVGGGHAHIQVLRSWAMAPVPGARLTLVVDRPMAVYSGMVPGLVAGFYRREELEIDLRPLAMRAGARYFGARATGIDPGSRRLSLDGRPPIAYDAVSFDVGSGVARSELPGVSEHAIATRPIGRFVALVEKVMEDLAARSRERPGTRLAVVGAGAGGVELAFALRARQARAGIAHASVLLLEAGPRILPGYPQGAVARVEARARALDIEIRCGAAAAEVGPESVTLEGGEKIPAEAVVWASGASSLPIFGGSGLATDRRGFLRVRPTLQSLEREEIFAAGDCASLGEEPGLPKAGVYAVRQGPVLVRNLRAWSAGEPLEEYRPQRDFLSLLNLSAGPLEVSPGNHLGQEWSVGSKWGFSFEGAWVFRLKDRIDRRFMRRFQALRPDGAEETGRGAPPPAMESGPLCGGCASKLGGSELSRALERLGVQEDPAVILGLGLPDDAAAVRTEGGRTIVSTIDSFRPFTDDPYLVGRVAAVNSASDLWAKGVAPRFALAQVTVGEGDPERGAETLYQALAGARAAFEPEGITLVGGHTSTGAELAIGFAVFGTQGSAEKLFRKSGLAAGDLLILTKPLGTGVLFHADMRGLARGEWIEAAIASMLRTNAAASRALTAAGASASTDVSGFGLAGHLSEMLRASHVSARIDLGAIPLLPGARELLARGLRSTFHPENARGRRAILATGDARERIEFEAIFDPQTSGGLLFGVPATSAERALALLHEGSDARAAVIGEVLPARADGAIIEAVFLGPAESPIAGGWNYRGKTAGSRNLE